MATQNLFGNLALDATVASTNTKLDTITRAEDSVHISGDSGVPLLAVRQDADGSPVSATGDYQTLLVNESGRLKVTAMPGDYAPITGDITAIQAVISTPVAGGTVVADISRASNINIFCTGTFAGVNCIFEGNLDATGETTWFGVQGVRTNANTIETATGVLATQPAYAWEVSVNALARFRVRATARTSGTQSWRILPGAYATEPIPASQVTATQPISGTISVTSTAINALATVTGKLMSRNVALSSTKSTVKAGSGRVYSWYFKNPHATATAWVHFYDALIAGVTIGTTVPVWSVEVPAGGTNEFDTSIPFPFVTGITIASTTSELHTGTTAPTTPLITFVGYI